MSRFVSRNGVLELYLERSVGAVHESLSLRKISFPVIRVASKASATVDGVKKLSYLSEVDLVFGIA